MRWSIGAAIFPAFLASEVLGQAFSNATCSAASSWTFNTLEQTPCVVAAYLGGVCFNGKFSVYALVDGPTDSYATLTGNGVNLCECSGPFYNLVQACSYCQGSEIVAWSNFTASCPAVYTDATGFPNAIPSGTEVPTWAFLDPRPVGAWSAANAQAYEASSSASITPGLSSTASSTTVASSTTTSPAATSAAAKSSSSTGPIVGGVVGGLVVVALLVVGLWFCLRRRGADAQRPTDFAAPTYPRTDFPQSHGANPTYTADPAPPVPVGYLAGNHGVQEKPADVGMGGQMGYLNRPYNPSDPSTYPSSPGSRGSALYSPQMTTSYLSNQEHAGQYQPGGFNPNFQQPPQNNMAMRQDMGQVSSPPPIYDGPAPGGQGYTYRPEL